MVGEEVEIGCSAPCPLGPGDELDVAFGPGYEVVLLRHGAAGPPQAVVVGEVVVQGRVVVLELGKGFPPVGGAEVARVGIQFLLALPHLLPSVGFNLSGIHVKAVTLLEHEIEGSLSASVGVVRPEGEVGLEPVFEPAEGVGGSTGGVIRLVGLNVVVAEELGQAGLQKGQGAVALPDGPFRPSRRSRLNVFACLPQQDLYAVHPLCCRLQPLIKGSEGAAKQR